MSDSLATSITRAPISYDNTLATDVTSGLHDALCTGALGDLVHGTAGSSPFLAGLLDRHGAWLAVAVEQPENEVLDCILTVAKEAGRSTDWPGLLSALRLAKARAALFIALADLGGAWDLGNVTRALTDVAETLTETALRWLVTNEIALEKIPGMTEEDISSGAGICVLAMGKMGARELNYSSDIDLICLFDQDGLDDTVFSEVKARYIHVTRQLTKALSERTPDGYVFRTDLRLRPSPSVTPVCLSMEKAERYYYSVGRTWERAAHIKARPAAGDIVAGRAYLDRLSAFIWHRDTDFAAIQDVEDIRRKIRENKGNFHPARLPGYNIKLGPGGIREIEFFTQTQQLIMGGRLPGLRDPTTLGALAALRDEGIIREEMCATLSEAYIAHRNLEHRLQMVADAQTQTIPVSEDSRARVVALDGWADQKAWEIDITERLATVHSVIECFFDAVKSRTTQTNTPETDEHILAACGFERPKDAYRMIRSWRLGEVVATRSDRARRIYATLEVDLVNLFGQVDSPDDAIIEFDRFLSSLPTGVQVFSLFKANPPLLKLVVDIFATAPSLAAHLGRAPQALDALLESDFSDKFPQQDWLEVDLHIWIGDTTDFECVLDITRRWARELKFRAGVQILRGTIDMVEAGNAFSSIAETVLRGLMPFVIEDFASRHGPPPGRGMAVIAMGKLGTREMTAKSDIDLITIYDASKDEMSNGPRPLPSSTYYLRLTQLLISALSAPTAEGRLYEVDMRLRPSGRQGPIAISLASFKYYQAQQAWVWEHLSLSRARLIFGGESLTEDISQVIDTVLLGRKGDPRVIEEAREMRARLLKAHRQDRLNPWSLKHTLGGLVEIEFFAQTGGLFSGMGGGRPAREILYPLADMGWMTPTEAKNLDAALSLQTCLQQIECIALDPPFDLSSANEKLRQTLVDVTEISDFDTLTKTLKTAQTDAAAACARVFDATTFYSSK